MKTSSLNVLLIEDCNEDAELIREMLCGPGRKCNLKRVERLSEGLKMLEKYIFDVVLLDLGLPDSMGVNALAEINQRKLELPVIVFTGLENDELAARALSMGAQDYLLKNRIDSDMLYRSIEYSINRKQAEETIRKAKELSDALNDINSLINSTLDAEEIMQMVVAEGAHLTGADGSSIGLFQDDYIFLKYVHNMPREFTGKRLTPDEAKHIYYTASGKQAVAFNNTATDDRIDAHFARRFGIFAVLVAPLIIRDEAIGSLCFYRLSPGAFTEIYVDAAQKLSAAVSAALENARLYDNLKKMDDEIRHLAYHDALTGLPNRRLFNSLVDHELAQSIRHNKKMAIFFLDLDRFKDINDTLGHEAGDELLKEVSYRLKSTIRACDTIARIGGDEFNIILADIDHVEVIADIAQKIVECFRNSFMIAGHELHMTTSIGISICPDDGEEIDTLLSYADIAMYHAKKEGRNTYQFFDPETNNRTIERMRMNNLLLHSVERGELAVHYQPHIDIETKDIVGAEALVRWQHPAMGLLDAAEFIPLAEETGFVASIDEWVLRTVCKQVKLWQEVGLSICITVNLSARQLQSPQLVDKLTQIFDETGVQPGCLHLEITETVAMHNIERTAERLKVLYEMGVRFYIDDFGTGYSSLNYLKRLPIECLKIDKSFIRDIADDADGRTIISAVTALAHKMRLKVIAEGVETQEQFSFLRFAGCDEVQGFLFSKAVPAENFSELISVS